MARGGAGDLTARAAIYYAPRETDPLWAAGCAWLGRDPASGRTLPCPPDRTALVGDPCRYGFHATLKPPMRLAHPWHALMEDAAALARRLAPFALPPLAVVALAGFLALRETEACPALQALADACVTELDAHRVPPDADEIARRRRASLTPLQDRMLLDWGYPYVLGTWRFHMTLTRRLTPEERPVWLPAAQRLFAGAVALERRVDSICLFTQPEAGAAFLLAERLDLG